MGFVMNAATPLDRLCRVLLLVTSLSVASKAAEEPIVRLAKAVKEGDVVAVRKLIAEGADPNARVPSSELGRTPLFLAVEADKPEVTEALLQAGANPAIADENGDAVIVAAADHERIRHARILMAHGVSIDSRDRSGMTPLMRGAPYEKGPDVQAMVDLGADLNLADAEGYTALMIAAKAGNQAAVKVLVEAGAKLDLRNQKGQTALMIAASRDAYNDEDHVTPRVVELVIKGGADLNLRDSSGKSALMIAMDSWSVKQETLDVLLAAKLDVAIRDKDGRDALFMAVSDEKRKACIEPLLKLGADIKTTDSEGVDLLMLAAVHADLDQTRDFLKRGLTPERRSKSGESAVHFAARSMAPSASGLPSSSEKDDDDHGKRVAEILRLFHEQGASLTAADEDGVTPLHLAAWRGSTEAVAYLLPHFPDPDLAEAERETPLHYAAAGGSVAVLDLLLAKSPKLESKGAAGETPLWQASAVGNQEAVERLVKAGADINATNAEGITPLANAMDKDRQDQARQLLALGADPKRIADPSLRLLKAARQFHDRPMSKDDYLFPVGLFASIVDDINRGDADGMTALMWVAASNIPSPLKSVLDRKPDLNVRSTDGRTALMWAASAGALESMKTLRAAGADDELRDHSGRSAADWLAWSTADGVAPQAEVPAGQVSLLERVLRSRRMVLDAYLKRGAWSADDRIAGMGPLHLAAVLGDSDAILALLKLGALPNQLAAGSSPLIEAASNGHAKAVEVLLAHGADPSLRGEDDERAIDQAVSLGHADVARILLHREKPFVENESELLAALVRHSDAELLREFLKAGASIPRDAKVQEDSIFDGRKSDPSAPLKAAVCEPDSGMLRVLMEFPDATGVSVPGFLALALHQAAECGRLANVRFLIEEKQVDQDVLLDDSFAGVTRYDSGNKGETRPSPVKGYSALSRALEEGHFDIVRYLVDRGAAITGRTRGGEPPLSFAARHSQLEMLRLFLEHKALTELVDIDGETALHSAARSNDATAVKLLLEHGAHAGVKSKIGLTPLDLARTLGAKDVIPLLEKPAK